MYIIANFKMYGSRQFYRELAQILPKLSLMLRDAGNTLVLCPPAVYLSEMSALLTGIQDTENTERQERRGQRIIHSENLEAQEEREFKAVTIGAQDVSIYGGDGAHTGEVSARMLADIGCKYVIIGHSERRAQSRESEDSILAKFHKAQQAGLIPILCIGSDSQDWDEERRRMVVAVRRATACAIPSHPYLIAYEPVWAIGTGSVPSSEALSMISLAINENLTTFGSLIYGGSVDANTSNEIVKIRGINGIIVGRVSISLDKLRELIKSCCKSIGTRL